MSTDHEWERWGSTDPYYGVLTNPKFRSAALNPQAKEEFFFSGRCHVSYVYDTCRRFLDPHFAPQRILDFGCGVGRLVVAFAEHAPHVVGMDVSPSMLAEARRNCDERGAANVELVPSDDQLAAAPGPFDLVHSCIVLQHIEIPRGLALFERLIDRIRPGGYGALHLTYAWDVYHANHGVAPPPPPAPPVGGALAQVKASLRTLVSPPPAPAQPSSGDPEMQMNFYNLSQVLFIVQRAGVTELHTHFTDHGGALGVFLFFRKPPAAAEPA